MRTDKKSVPYFLVETNGWIEEVMFLREFVLSTGLKKKV